MTFKFRYWVTLKKSKNIYSSDQLKMSFRLRDNSLHLVGGSLIILTSIVGLLGNVFIILIVTRRQLWKHIFYKLQFSLAYFDTITVFCFGYGMSYFCLFVAEETFLLEGYIISYIGLYGSVYITMLISLEHYLGICETQIKWRRYLLTYLFPLFILLPLAVLTAFSEKCAYYKMKKFSGIIGKYYRNLEEESSYGFVHSSSGSSRISFGLLWMSHSQQPMVLCII